MSRKSQKFVLENHENRGSDAGRYVNPPDAGYERVRFDHDTHKPDRLVSRQVAWSYQSKSNQGFFSHIGSGAERLPNGNTLICSMTEGHFFEVTAAGDLVWEYVNPITRDGAVKVLPDSLPMTNAVFRAYRYGPDHPALAGKDFTPQGTLTALAEKGLLKIAAPREHDRRQNPERDARRPAGGVRPRDPEQQPNRHNHPVLIALDADGDGEITAQEMQKAVATLTSLDKDGDGWVRREEMGPSDGGRREPKPDGPNDAANRR